MPTMKFDIAYLRKDVHYLKCVDFNDLMRLANDGGFLVTSEIPLATTGVVHIRHTTDMAFDEYTDEELVAMHEDKTRDIQEESIYKDLPDLVARLK